MHKYHELFISQANWKTYGRPHSPLIRGLGSGEDGFIKVYGSQKPVFLCDSQNNSCSVEKKDEEEGREGEEEGRKNMKLDQYGGRENRIGTTE